jgi:homospermidine synthase
MGCNPGNVSMWTKWGLIQLNEKKIGEKWEDSKEWYAKIAEKLRVQTIHISEHDSQITQNPRHTDEYCNTWSSDPESFYQEALGPVEMSWGTHENEVPNSYLYMSDEKEKYRVMILKELGIQRWMRSYTPITGMFHGMMIRHDENLTIGEYLSRKDKKKRVMYQPSVYYVYKPTDACLSGIEETREKGDHYEGVQKRLLTSDIIDGSDELGISFFLENGEVYWIGSLLTIEEARSYHPSWMWPYINATNVQVVGGYLTGIFYLVDLWERGEHCGLLFPEDIPMEYIKISLGFQGEFVLEKAKWKHEKPKQLFGQDLKQRSWQWEEFCV